MSAICHGFVENAWRKDICSNCFRLRDEHRANHSTSTHHHHASNSNNLISPKHTNPVSPFNDNEDDQNNNTTAVSPIKNKQGTAKPTGRYQSPNYGYTSRTSASRIIANGKLNNLLSPKSTNSSSSNVGPNTASSLYSSYHHQNQNNNTMTSSGLSTAINGFSEKSNSNTRTETFRYSSSGARLVHNNNICAASVVDIFDATNGGPHPLSKNSDKDSYATTCNVSSAQDSRSSSIANNKSGVTHSQTCTATTNNITNSGNTHQFVPGECSGNISDTNTTSSNNCVNNTKSGVGSVSSLVVNRRNVLNNCGTTPTVSSGGLFVKNKSVLKGSKNNNCSGMDETDAEGKVRIGGFPPEKTGGKMDSKGILRGRQSVGKAKFTVCFPKEVRTIVDFWFSCE